ncbi:hypothetical protein N7456_008233 [Penicillium angulare]|uniref:NB-ARC domain-containing protein n=1 Tax=Penicillium angulare TaxID=116970 RepID=A0A9W9FCA4_9EURO|nr:hypothetical protein N7456_008233 [Penicillium angulare]
MTSSVTFLGPNHGLQVGNNYGSINAEFHLPPENDPISLSPVSTVPFERDPDFLQQGLLPEQVADICSKPAARLALVGPGGIGKSQIAIEHAYRTRDQSPDTWVFWIHASNSARFELSYREIADKVKIPARIDPNANIFKLVHNWLQDPKHGKWVLILDSLDNDDFLRRVPSGDAPLSTFLPRCTHGSVIFTTRRHHVAERYVTPRNIIRVDPDESHSVALMRKKLGAEQEFENIDVVELVRALASIPLAVIQAAAYITKNAPRFTVAKYLEQFQKSDQKRVKLLEHEAGDLHRDWEAKSSILVTWQMSFDYIRETRKSAADLLALMSFFDAQDMPEVLLRGSADEVNDVSSIKSDHSLDFEDDVQILREYSFISVNQDTKSFQMHSLVQTAVQRWVNVHEDRELWKSQFVQNLLRAFPRGNPLNCWGKCHALYQHVQRALSQRPNSDETLKDWAALLYRGAKYAQTGKSPQAAQELVTKSRTEFERILGSDHPWTISSAILQAKIFGLQGQLNNAQETLFNILKRCEKVFGNEHHVTLQAKDDLAEIYYNQSRFQDAEKLWEQILLFRKASSGEQHSSTLAVKGNLGTSYTEAQNSQIDQKKFQKGLTLLSEVLEARKKTLPEDHPSTLMAKSSISSVYIEQRKLKEAEEMELQLLESYKKVFGDEHQYTLFSVVKLGTIYTYMDQPDLALPYGIKAVDVYQKTLGEKDFYTIGSMGNLIIMYGRLDRFQEAEPLAQAVFEAKKESLGEKHPETTDAMEILAMVYEGLKRDKEASSLRWEVTKARVDAYRDKHRRRFSHNNLLSLTAKVLVSAIDRFA